MSANITLIGTLSSIVRSQFGSEWMRVERKMLVIVGMAERLRWRFACGSSIRREANDSRRCSRMSNARGQSLNASVVAFSDRLVGFAIAKHAGAANGRGSGRIGRIGRSRVFHALVLKQRDIGTPLREHRVGPASRAVLGLYGGSPALAAAGSRANRGGGMGAFGVTLPSRSIGTTPCRSPPVA
jgi:hypothetical protein